MSGVFKRKRVRNGKRVTSRTYYCIDGKTVNLGVTDKQSAEVMRVDLIRRHEREAAGLERNREEREALERSTLGYLEDYLDELETRERVGLIHSRCINIKPWKADKSPGSGRGV